MRRKTKKNRAAKRYYIPLTVLMLAVVVATFVLSLSTSGSSHRNEIAPTKKVVRQAITKITGQAIELPACQPNDSLIVNRVGRYTLQYSPHYRSAVWVAYKLTHADTRGRVGRSSSFVADAELRRRGFEVATNGDYSKSGYDKGHLLPSADRQGSIEENRATFILSNCAPQRPALNRGVWKRLEEYLRELSRAYDTLYIVTGTILRPESRRLGRARVAVADRYFKAVLARRNNTFTSMGYIMPNEVNVERDIEQYKVSVDSIERVTGLDLFPEITTL